MTIRTVPVTLADGAAAKLHSKTQEDGTSTFTIDIPGQQPNAVLTRGDADTLRVDASASAQDIAFFKDALPAGKHPFWSIRNARADGVLTVALLYGAIDGFPWAKDDDCARLLQTPGVRELDPNNLSAADKAILGAEIAFVETGDANASTTRYFVREYFGQTDLIKVLDIRKTGLGVVAAFRGADTVFYQGHSNVDSHSGGGGPLRLPPDISAVEIQPKRSQYQGYNSCYGAFLLTGLARPDTTVVAALDWNYPVDLLSVYHSVHSGFLGTVTPGPMVPQVALTGTKLVANQARTEARDRDFLANRDKYQDYNHYLISTGALDSEQ